MPDSYTGQFLAKLVTPKAPRPARRRGKVAVAS